VIWGGSDVAAAVTVRIVSAVAVHLGISGGILSTGAASGMATLGIGLAAGFVLDSPVDFILRQAGYDPAGQIAAKTAETLENIRFLLIEGDQWAHVRYQMIRQLQSDGWRQALESLNAEGVLGLRHEINRLRKLRKSFRDAALKKLIGEGGQS
jgi:hypothetical protein